ncbi:MAG: hypothetical protein WCT12_31950 [Verrucomicrobiota bacterium]
MSVLSGISSSAGVSYATELAQTSALKRNLNNLGTAVQNGDLTSAGSILSAFIKANPQFAITSSADSQAQDPINQDFQALADAITNNLADTAKSAWTQIKSDLATSGATDLSDGTAATAELLAQTQTSLAQQILSNAFGTSSGDGLSLMSLIGGNSGASGSVGSSSSVFSDWLIYQAGGNTSPAAASASAGNRLNTTA